MEIKFIKDLGDDYIFSKVLSLDEILLISNEESEYDNILVQRYYKYNIATKEKEELIPHISKYDIVSIEDFGLWRNIVYFCTCSNVHHGKGKISLLRYNLYTKIADVCFQFEDDITLYPLHKTMTIFILNDNFLIIQEGYLRSNRTGNFDSICEFRLYLYEVSSNIRYPIVDDRLVRNGIYTMFSVNDQRLIIKTGTTLLADNRWDYFSRYEAPSEYILIVNKDDFIKSVISLTNNIPLTVIDCETWDKTINYFSVKDNFIIYTKTSYPSYDEEFVFYNYITRQSYSWKSESTGNGEYCSASHLIIKDYPYIVMQTRKGSTLLNLSEVSKEIELNSDVIIKDSYGDIIIMQIYGQRIRNSSKSIFVGVYKFPEMKLIMERKGMLFSCVNAIKNLVCIIIESEDGS